MLEILPAECVKAYSWANLKLLQPCKLITNVAQLQTVITKVKMFRAFLSDTQQLKKWEIHMKRGDGFFATVGNRFCFSEHFTPTDFNPLTSKPAETCLMPDDFTRQWGTPGSQ